MFHLLRCAESFLHFEHILLAFLKNGSAHRRRWNIIFWISWFDDFLIYNVIPQGRYNCKWVPVPQVRIKVFFKIRVWPGSDPGLTRTFFRQKLCGSDPGQTRNFTKKVRPLCVAMRWSRKSRPRGIYVKFDSLSYGKTYTTSYQVVLRKKF